MNIKLLSIIFSIFLVSCTTESYRVSDFSDVIENVYDDGKTNVVILGDYTIASYFNTYRHTRLISRLSDKCKFSFCNVLGRENIYLKYILHLDTLPVILIVEDGEIVKIRPKAKIGEYLIYEGKHEGIVSEELFKAAQERMGKNPRTKPTTKVRNPLAGLLYCHCGRAMTYRTHKNKDGSEKSAPRLMCDGQTHCGTGSCKFDEMLDKVIQVLEQCIDDFEMRLTNDTGDSVKLHTKLIKGLEKKLEDLKKKELSQWEQQSHPDPDQRMPPHIFKQLNDKLLKEKEEINEALCKAYESMPEPIDYGERVARFKDALEALKNPEVDAETKNILLKSCIERIEYKREKAQRINTQQTTYYDKERKRTRYTSPLNVGANWTNPPIEIDVKLKV